MRQGSNSCGNSRIDVLRLGKAPARSHPTYEGGRPVLAELPVIAAPFCLPRRRSQKSLPGFLSMTEIDGAMRPAHEYLKSAMNPKSMCSC
jgi:hypothetical protein